MSVDTSWFGGQPQGGLVPATSPLETSAVEHGPKVYLEEPTGGSPAAGSTKATSPEIPGLIPGGGVRPH